MKGGAGANAPPVPRTALDEHTVFRSMFLAYPDALLLVDAAGQVVLANPAAAELLGYSVAELVQLDVDALVPDGVRRRHGAFRQAYAHNPRARPMGTTQTELVAKRGDGSEVAVEIALSPLREHGLPLVVASIRGIAAFPRVQQALRRARYAEQVARLGRLAVDTRDTGSLIEQAPRLAADVLQADAAGVLLVEVNGREVRVAGGVGLLPDEAPGTRFVPSAGTPEHHVLACNEPVVVDDVLAQTHFVFSPAHLAAGLRSALLVPITDRSRSVGLFVLRSRRPQCFGADEVQAVESMASLLATTLQRAHSEEALNHAQRLESVGQLTGGIAHDFNNLLTVILGNLQVLEERPEVAAGAGRPLVAAAARAAKRGAELTGKLLAFSRRQVLQPARVDVGALLDSLAAMLRRTLDQHIRITVDTAVSCPPVRADAGQLEAALLNIAINARDAMRDGGLLSFTAKAGEAGEVAIAVGDTGGGMAYEVRERAFEPFFTTKDKGRGTGLGLSTVHGFVSQSGGRIEIDSVIGSGTTVTMHLPCWRDATPAQPAERGRAVEPLPPHLQVLLVEDDADVRAVVRGFLADAAGCEIETASSAESALAMLAGRRFDLLLTDIALGPGLRGTELARQAQVMQPALAVLLISGFAAEMLDQAHRRDGGGGGDKLPWELLRKPFSREELMRALVRALGRPLDVNAPPPPPDSPR